MKRRDLSRIFGVDDADDVPHYEVVQPMFNQQQAEAYEEEILRVKRDDTLDEPPAKFGVNAFNNEYHFNLSLNEHLFSPNFEIEVKHADGVTRKKRAPNCHYTGKINGVKNSLVAISTCHGLSGYFTADQYDYFIEPLPNYLHEVEGLPYHKPHIVVRRSLDDMFPKPQSLRESFSRIWYKGNPLTRTCATKSDPNVRFQRALDDDAPYVKNGPKVDNTERYIETLVVVDQKMVHYHGEDAATQFALVVLNIVASLLRDGSIGTNLIILVVVKLELHTVDVPGLVINHHARNTLESFGTWAARGSDQDDRSDDHYDYGILLTRYNICADETQPCDLLGVAQTGGMCNWPYSASVNKDNGFPLAFTITHSIGHSLGMNHDGDESSFICPDNTYIMASTISSEWMETRKLWSRCSRNYLRQFLKKPQSNCLRDLPAKSRSLDYSIMDNKPGVLYDASKQCEMQFGTGSNVCHKDTGFNICQRMYCTNPADANKCFTSTYPAVDGTSCAPNRWCYRGKCIGNNEVLALDGGWASWSGTYQPCSRSCGGGVQYRVRQCNNPKPANGGKYCEGESRTYQLCNTKPCSNGVKSHRSLQCSRLDNRLFGERKFDWEFKPSKIEPCKLGCFIAGTGHGYDFGSVEDGTNCDQLDDSVVADKCINGECKTVGCDGIIGSRVKFDRCGVCDGDGSTCLNGVEKSIVPEAANSGMSVALNSLKDIGFDLGTLYGKSSLSLAEEKRSGIPHHGDFVWARIKSGCPVSCGGGIEVLTAECRRQDDGSPAREEMCDPALKPPVQNYPCKEEPCPPVWKTSYWGDCTKTCNGGIKKRNVRCVQKSGNGVEYSVDTSLCSGRMPPDTEGCNKEPCPSEWIAQPFGECSTICGPGVQIRDVFCQKVLKDGTILSGKVGECRPETKPPVEQKCNVHNPCPGDASCGGIYTDPVGNFTSPNYPKNYSNNMECIHIIQVPEKQVIKMEFDDVAIVAPDSSECKNDFVKIMDGDCVSRLGETKVCGHDTPPPFVSTTNRICVKFFSDDTQTDRGFSVKYHAIDEPLQRSDMCGINLTSAAGLVSSPNYPDYYPPNEDCNITVSGDEKPIHLTFHAFDVGSDDCSNDYVVLMGGEVDRKLCGQKLPATYTTSGKNDLLVRFVSTDHATTMKPGFVATYTSESSSNAPAYPSVNVAGVTKSNIEKKPDVKPIIKNVSATIFTPPPTEEPQKKAVNPEELKDLFGTPHKEMAKPTIVNITHVDSKKDEIVQFHAPAEQQPKAVIEHRDQQAAPSTPQITIDNKQYQAPAFINTVHTDQRNESFTSMKRIYKPPQQQSAGGTYQQNMYDVPTANNVIESNHDDINPLSQFTKPQLLPSSPQILPSSPQILPSSFDDTSPQLLLSAKYSPSQMTSAQSSLSSLLPPSSATSEFGLRQLLKKSAASSRRRLPSLYGGGEMGEFGQHGRDFIPQRPMQIFKSRYAPVSFVSTQPDGIAMDVKTTSKKTYITAPDKVKLSALQDISKQQKAKISAKLSAISPQEKAKIAAYQGISAEQKAKIAAYQAATTAQKKKSSLEAALKSLNVAVNYPGLKGEEALSKSRSDALDSVNLAMSTLGMKSDDAYVILENMNALKNSKYSKLPNAARSYMKTNNLYNSDYITHSESDIHKKGYYNARMLARINNEKRNQIAKAAAVARHNAMKSHQRMMAKAAPITPLKQTLKEAEHIKYNVAKSLALEQQDDIPGEELLNLRYGVCPDPKELKCLRLLYSYSCTNDATCGDGFVCCLTSCQYGKRMCTPMISKHCPLRDPFYYPQLPCNIDSDCPGNSPCCLDMSNKRYCRHHKRKKPKRTQIPLESLMLFG